MSQLLRYSGSLIPVDLFDQVGGEEEANKPLLLVTFSHLPLLRAVIAVTEVQILELG